MLAQDLDAVWETTDRKNHLVTTRHAGRLFTDCGIYMNICPGLWRKADATCRACLREPEGLVLQREAGLPPYWRFRTTGGVIHAIPFGLPWDGVRSTYCGFNTVEKCINGTGAWEFEPLTLSCIGCLAVAP